MADVDGTRLYVGEGLAAAGDYINSRSAQIVDELEALKAKLAPLEAAWKLSKAAAYYQDRQVEWNLGADGLFDHDGVLGEIARTMRVAWGNYEEAEWANIRTWQRTRVSTGERGASGGR
jgi:uncharacterized protein YukE